MDRSGVRIGHVLDPFLAGLPARGDPVVLAPIGLHDLMTLLERKHHLGAAEGAFGKGHLELGCAHLEAQSEDAVENYSRLDREAAARAGVSYVIDASFAAIERQFLRLFVTDKRACSNICSPVNPLDTIRHVAVRQYGLLNSSSSTNAPRHITFAVLRLFRFCSVRVANRKLPGS